MASEAAYLSVPVTPSDSVNVPNAPARGGLWCGTGGIISYVPYDPTQSNGMGTAMSTTIAVGHFPVQVMRVNATGTIAGGIAALY